VHDVLLEMLQAAEAKAAAARPTPAEPSDVDDAEMTWR